MRAHLPPARGTTASPGQPHDLATVLFPSHCTCVPQERPQLGPTPAPSVPSASGSAGEQVRAPGFAQAGPDGRLLGGPRRGPLQKLRATEPCFQTSIPQSESPGLGGELCSFAFREAWLAECPEGNIVSIKSEALTFQPSGSKAGSGIGGGPPWAGADPCPQASARKGPRGRQAGLATGHRMPAGPAEAQDARADKAPHPLGPPEPQNTRAAEADSRRFGPLTPQ